MKNDGTDGKAETMADKINAELAAGNIVTATVYAGGAQFSKRHAGLFTMDRWGNVVFTGRRKITFLRTGTRWTVHK